MRDRTRAFAAALTIAGAFAASARGVAAGPQPNLGPMGIDERLGAQVPLDLTLLDETGRKVTLRSLIDRPTVLTLNYFTCVGICSPQLNGVADMLSQIALEPGKDFRILTVSFDPRDTPQVAAHKRENLLKVVRRPMPPDAWHFLTGDAASTKALADSVGYEFQRVDGSFVHPGAIIVLTPAGRVARYILGIHFMPADVQMALDDAARGVSRPTVAQSPINCNTSDPQGRGVARRVMRIAGAATLGVLGLALGGMIWWTRARGKGGRK
jgi:protein SCO1/2